MNKTTKNIGAFPIRKTAQILYPVLILCMLSTIFTTGCFWGEWEEVGERCEGDILYGNCGEGEECTTNCPETQGVGCMEIHSEQGGNFIGCAQEDSRCDATGHHELFRLDFCYSTNEVGVCKGGHLSNIIKCHTGEICYPYGNSARCLIIE